MREALRVEIVSGRWVKQLPSERHLSQEFQVGRPTLHLALRSLELEGMLRSRPGKPWIIVTHPSASGRPSPKRRAMVVVVRNARVKPDLTSFLPLIDLLRQKLHRIGLDLAVVDALVRGTKELDKTLREVDAKHRPSFYFLFSVPADVHHWFQKGDVPTLIFGLRAPGVTLPAVTVDSDATIRHAIEQLHRHGHRHIGLLMPTVAGEGDACLRKAFFDCCARFRAQASLQMAVARPDAVKAAIRRFFVRPPFPTALITTDLELVIGAYSTLAEMGLSIPRKVSVISMWHWPILDFLSPLPTCYQIPWNRMATHSLRLINDHLRLGVWPGTFHNLLPTLREGSSVATI